MWPKKLIESLKNWSGHGLSKGSHRFTPVETVTSYGSSHVGGGGGGGGVPFIENQLAGRKEVRDKGWSLLYAPY